jgi:hypothetical protein
MRPRAFERRIRMADTGEDRQIRSRVKAKETATVRSEKKMLGKEASSEKRADVAFRSRNVKAAGKVRAEESVKGQDRRSKRKK